ncbi:unnamed protein product [Porites evermanni]|uniref:Uncharacterized protein n=1 Tax=Porites evermanni TaxID=104178 RepID=A0ABN8LE00_9CNID|nr:unnamed protein product [Porites evermanni]
MNVAEDQALLLPGRACAAVGHESVGYSKFCDLWTQLCPFIVIMRPASDLC